MSFIAFVASSAFVQVLAIEQCSAVVPRQHPASCRLCAVRVEAAVAGHSTGHLEAGPGILGLGSGMVILALQQVVQIYSWVRADGQLKNTYRWEQVVQNVIPVAGMAGKWVEPAVAVRTPVVAVLEVHSVRTCLLHFLLGWYICRVVELAWRILVREKELVGHKPEGASTQVEAAYFLVAAEHQAVRILVATFLAAVESAKVAV
jgi:hypothetical protein